LADAAFAKVISNQYNLPLIANERCGSWYIDPSDKAGSAYFKSTDGHHGQWDFSLRRLNLQLIPVLGNSGGAVVVDSTRRGKNLPDSFSKTVPIWVAVMNRTLFPELVSTHPLQHPPAPDDLGLSEVSQIEARLDGFVQSFTQLGLDIHTLRTQLKYPIQITWEINGRSRIDFEEEEEEHDSGAQSIPKDRQFNRIVLCSASQRVRGAEASEGGYIQGAGDDSEAWSHGLTAQTFWKHREELMQSPEDELELLIETLLERDRQDASNHVEVVRVLPASQLYIAAGFSCNTDKYTLIVNCQNDQQIPTINPRIIDLKCRSMKLGSKDLRDQLLSASKVIFEQLRKDDSSRILVTCSSGKDLSVGVLVAVLCLHYDDQGRLIESGVPPRIDKNLVKQRLTWITNSKPDANPSRATLQAVNAFLMHRPD